MAIKHDTPSAVEPGKPGSSLFPDSPLGEKVEGIPTGREVAWEPLVDYRRNGVSETTIHGAIAWSHGDETVPSTITKTALFLSRLSRWSNISWTSAGASGVS